MLGSLFPMQKLSKVVAHEAATWFTPLHILAAIAALALLIEFLLPNLSTSISAAHLGGFIGSIALTLWSLTFRAKARVQIGRLNLRYKTVRSSAAIVAAIGLAFFIVQKVSLGMRVQTEEPRPELAANPPPTRQTPASIESVIPMPPVESVSNATPEPPVLKTDNLVKVNQPFTLGDFSYEITGIDQERFIGNEFLHKDAGDDATYVIVSYRITNKSNETQTVLADDFELKTDRGVIYRPDSDALVAYAASGGNNDFIFSQLQPGVMKNSATVFLVPAEVLNSKLYLRVPEKGWLSTGEVLVSLN
jgi:hypothetical protein